MLRLEGAVDGAAADREADVDVTGAEEDVEADA